MGTETPFPMHLVQSVVPHVKINDPHKGAGTYISWRVQSFRQVL